QPLLVRCVPCARSGRRRLGAELPESTDPFVLGFAHFVTSADLDGCWTQRLASRSAVTRARGFALAVWWHVGGLVTRRRHPLAATTSLPQLEVVAARTRDAARAGVALRSRSQSELACRARRKR